MAVYPQFCAVARALEILGERWTLLIVRELLLGPKRFSDLKGRLDGISSSVLSQRLSRLEEDGLVRRTYLDPPAASTVFELTERGRGLELAIFALIRWGGGLLNPPRPGERREPEWIGLVLRAYARKGAVPQHAFEIRLREGDRQAVYQVRGTPQGTAVSAEGDGADVTITVGFETLLSLVAGSTDASSAVEDGLLEAEGDFKALTFLPRMFDLKEEVTSGSAA